MRVDEVEWGNAAAFGDEDAEEDDLGNIVAVVVERGARHVLAVLPVGVLGRGNAAHRDRGSARSDSRTARQIVDLLTPHPIGNETLDLTGKKYQWQPGFGGAGRMLAALPTIVQLSGASHETEIVAPETCRGIARAAVGIWKGSVGRGADFAQAFAGDYGIAMIFRGILTPLERTSVERGQAEAVAAIRRDVFEANRARLIEAVEQESGRTVESVLYACSPADDMSAFTFVLTRE